MKKTRKSAIALIALALVFVTALVAGRWADSSFGTVQVDTVEFASPTEPGVTYAGRLYVPAGASKDDPVPAAVFCMGNDTDSSKNAAFAVELSRRGVAVLSIDLRGQGFSNGEAWSKIPKELASVEPWTRHDESTGKAWADEHGVVDSVGATEATMYLRGLDFVDRDAISIMGHSRGAAATSFAIINHPDWYRAAVIMGVGYTKVQMAMPERAEERAQAGVKTDLAAAAEGVNIAFIYGLDDGNKDVPATLEYMGVEQAEWENGTVYGDFGDRDARMLYQSDTIHNLEYLNPGVIDHAVSFVTGASDVTTSIAETDQIWPTRVIATTVAFVALVAAIFPLGSLLLRTRCFAGLAAEGAPAYKGNVGAKWWVFAIVTAAVPPLTFFHVTTWSDELLTNPLWPVQRMTALMGWTLFGAIVSLAIILAARAVAKARGGKVLTLHDLGLTWRDGSNAKRIGVSFLLAAAIFAVLYAAVSLLFGWTGIFPLMWNNEFKPLIAERLPVYLAYVMPFTLGYLIFAINLHGTLRPCQGALSLGRELLVNLAITAPWYLVWAIWFGPFDFMISNGGYPPFAGRMYAYVWAMPAMMAVITTISTFFFRKTGHVWVGAFLNGLMITWAVAAGFCSIVEGVL